VFIFLFFSVVAHEIAHSWFGNYVGCHTWEHFWMNEGFTVFLERKILGSLKGEQYEHLHAIIGLKELKNSVERYGCEHPHTCLHVKLDGIDPGKNHL
jgi:leukotriene-A4 hydrolase